MFFIALATAPTLTARLGSTRMMDAEGRLTSGLSLPEHGVYGPGKEFS
jgi:hypothetical protein